ncbi:MAG: alanine racemase [Anaerolineaceae bacterium]|nr:alanine racemase [Anaerolineaceae bacterium]
MTSLSRSWVEIDLRAIANNARNITQRVGKDRKWLAVVKADGYGHGAIPVAKTAAEHGASLLAVASLEEALALRDAGIAQDILILSHCPTALVPVAVREKLILSVFDLATLQRYEMAIVAGETLSVHLKIDTGMGRMGVLPEQALPVLQALVRSDKLLAQGIYTHFASAAEEDEFTSQQIESLKRVLATATEIGLTFSWIHAANSAGLLGHGPQFGNLFRVGIALYGLEPTNSAPLLRGFQPALRWKTRVAQVKNLPAGHSVGYGRTYLTDRPERIAILPVGYADGYRRAPAAPQYVLWKGERCPIIGRISMEKTTVAVPDGLRVEPEDEVVLLGRQGEAQISAETVAAWLGTINYEVVTAISARLPRFYLD